MAIKFRLDKGSIGLFNVSGILGKAELEQAQNECESAIQKMGHIKILVVLDNFQGWEKAKDWEDLSFSARNDAYIDKLAIVGDQQWKDLVFAFTAKGLRPVLIEYFGEGQEGAARTWLNSTD